MVTHTEHAARAMLLKNDKGEQLWYDRYTNSYRPRSPEGSAYKYTGCLDADTLEPLKKGEALARQQPVEGVWRSNRVSDIRLGITRCSSDD